MIITWFKFEDKIQNNSKVIAVTRNHTDDNVDNERTKNNIFSLRLGGGRHNADSKTKPDWRDTTEAEIKAFIASLIVIGNNKRPRFRSYWSMEGFCSVMCRDRFMVLLRFLHVADNTRTVPRGQHDRDRCFKISPVVNILINQWQAVFFIDKCTSVDECMIGFKALYALSVLS